MARQETIHEKAAEATASGYAIIRQTLPDDTDPTRGTDSLILAVHAKLIDALRGSRAYRDCCAGEDAELLIVDLETCLIEARRRNGRLNAVFATAFCRFLTQTADDIRPLRPEIEFGAVGGYAIIGLADTDFEPSRQVLRLTGDLPGARRFCDALSRDLLPYDPIEVDGGAFSCLAIIDLATGKTLNAYGSETYLLKHTPPVGYGQDCKPVSSPPQLTTL